MDTTHTLRGANAHLYLTMSIAVVACAAWAIASGRICGTWQTCATALAALIALLWGGNYALLRWQVGPTGITTRSLLTRRFYPWNTLQSATAEHSDHQGIATYTLTFHFTEATLTLTSQLINPDTLHTLHTHLTTIGIIREATKDSN